MQESREELLTIVTNVNADTKDRKMAALQILKLYPELKEYRFCTKCGKSAEKFKKTYDGLHGDMHYYKYACSCGASNIMPEEYGDGISTSVSKIAFMNI